MGTACVSSISGKNGETKSSAKVVDMYSKSPWKPLSSDTKGRQVCSYIHHFFPRSESCFLYCCCCCFRRANNFFVATHFHGCFLVPIRLSSTADASHSMVETLDLLADKDRIIIFFHVMLKCVDEMPSLKILICLFKLTLRIFQETGKIPYRTLWNNNNVCI